MHLQRALCVHILCELLSCVGRQVEVPRDFIARIRPSLVAARRGSVQQKESEMKQAIFITMCLFRFGLVTAVAEGGGPVSALGPVETPSTCLKGFELSAGPEVVNWGDSRSPEVVQMIRRVRDFVGVLTVYNGGTEIGYGTAFLVATNRLVTNEHVIDGGDRCVFRLGNETFAVKGVTQFCRERDQVELAIERDAPGHLQIETGAPDLAESVWVIGNSRGCEGTVSDGIVSGVRGHLLQITAPINPGNSGGPILRLSGSVVGVATMTLKDSQNMNFGYRLLDEGWLGSGIPIPLAQFRTQSIAAGQEIVFPKMQKFLDEASVALARRYSSSARKTEVSTIGRSTSVDLESVLFYVNKRDRAALLSYMGLSSYLREPSEEHGELLERAVHKVLSANDRIIFSLCLLHGMDERTISRIASQGGSLSVSMNKWTALTHIVEETSSADANLLRSLLACNFGVCVHLYSLEG